MTRLVLDTPTASPPRNPLPDPDGWYRQTCPLCPHEHLTTRDPDLAAQFARVHPEQP
jgi:hypothetical protein